MTYLITSDLHLTDRPRDKYRFGLFRWLANQQTAHRTRATFILGDLTDRKDNHSSALVNRLIESILMLRPPVYILKGNHDYIDPVTPFFEFLNNIEGIHFVSTVYSPWSGWWMLPHCQSQLEFDKSCGKVPNKPAGVLIHNTIMGAIAETGAILPGLRASAIDFLQARGVWAGDIHRPQQCPWGSYVGAPFQVDFGDDFQPRVLLIKDGVGQDLHFPCLHKWALRIAGADQLLNLRPNLQPHDQVKITILLKPEEVVDWNKRKQRVLEVCRELNVDVFGLRLEITGATKSSHARLNPLKAVSPEQIFESYCESEGVPANIKSAGLEVLRG